MAVSVAGLEDPLGNPALLALLAPPTPLAGANDNPRGLRWPRYVERDVVIPLEVARNCNLTT